MRVTYWRDESCKKTIRQPYKSYALMSGILAQLVGSILCLESLVGPSGIE